MSRLAEEAKARGIPVMSGPRIFRYDMAKGAVTRTSPPLPWPHFFSDLSGIGGSAAASGDLMVVTACPHLAASSGLCADPELVALSL